MDVFMKLYTDFFIFFIQFDSCAYLKHIRWGFFHFAFFLNHNYNDIVKKAKKCNLNAT